MSKSRKDRQLKVATFTSGITRNTSLVLKCFEHHPEGMTPKMIALSTSINVNTIKGMLPKMPEIKRVTRGWYKVVNRGDGGVPLYPGELRDWTFHNCILSCQLPVSPPKTVISEIILNLVKLRFIINRTGAVTVTVSTDWPLNISSLDLLRGYMLQFLLIRFPGLPGSIPVHLKSIEFNRDYSNLRLDGVQSITIDNLVSQFKVYQKRRGMRVEHKTKVPLTVDNIIDLLTVTPQSLEMHTKLGQQKSQLDKLTQATVNNTNLLMKMMEERRK